MIGFIFLAIYFSFGFSVNNFKKKFIELLKANLFTFLILSLLLIPTIFICIYAYPRPHYLIMQVPFLLFSTALVLSSFNIKIDNPINKTFVLSFIWFFVTPAAEDFSYFTLFREEDSFCNVETIHYLKNNKFKKDTISIFDLEGGLVNLLPKKFTDNDFYYTDNKNIEISNYILKNKIDILYITPTLLVLNKVKIDTIFQDLIKEPKKYGYVVIKPGKFIPYLLIKDSIE
jgi:hypothetical protein